MFRNMKPVDIKYLNIILLSLLIVSCSKEGTDIEPDTYIKMGDEVSLSSLYNVQFYSKDSLFVGYNKVYFKVTEKSTGQFLSHAVISLHPLMDMGTFKHACPIENPAENSDSDGYFEGAIMFSMPGANNSWSLSADITVDGETNSAAFPISKVVGTTPVKKIVVIDSLPNGTGWTITKHPVSIVEPAAWKVGNNLFEITVHTMASMMSFPCCNEMTVEIIPEMPSMGHGSPNNVNPVLKANGHYEGTVNFTMTGAWRINMIFRKGDRVIGRNAYFDINF
jgi:hypothetical protein